MHTFVGRIHKILDRISSADLTTRVPPIDECWGHTAGEAVDKAFAHASVALGDKGE